MTDFQYNALAQIELDEENKRLHASELTLREYYQKNPAAYLIERLGVEPAHIDWELIPEYKNHKYHGTPNPLKKIIDSIGTGNWVGVESAKGVSKTWLGARLVLWFLDCFENSIVITAAPKQDQLSLHIWREISLIFPKFSKGQLLDLKLRMNDEETWLAIGFIAGSGTIEQTAQRAAGFHAEHMLIIFEETPGINQKVIDAFISSSSSPHNLILAFGNPDHQLDNLHKFCSLSNVDNIRISGYDFPNVVLDNANYIPGAQSRTGLDRLLIQYKSKENPLYQSHAEGISPSESIWSLIKKEWIDKAINKKIDKIEGENTLGVDVANSESGDEASICKGKGTVCLEIDSFPCPDANKLGHLIAQKCKDEDIPKSNILVDGIGVGAGTVNTLKEYDFDEAEINFIGSAKPVENDSAEVFNNRRSQAWYLCREDLRNGILSMPDDKELTQDLIAPQYTTKLGKICVEGKAEIKKRLGRSPNKGDSFVMWNFNRHKEPALKMFIMKQ